MEYLGATKERQSKGKIAQGERDHRIGKGYGHREVWPTLLDYYLDKGMLGGERDADERHSKGIRLRELYYSFNASGKDITTLMMSNATSGQFVVGEELTPGEKAEEKYHAVMRALPVKYHACARFVCIEDKAQDIELVRDMLDALYGAFYRVDGR